MPKLHLKRTPEEQAAHRERKRQKKQHKRKEATADDGPSYEPDYDAIQAELEEQRFRERMSMAFADDERLDSLEARFNDFAHIPKRWGGDSTRPVYDDDGDFMKLDPRYMDDEEYAEVDQGWDVQESPCSGIRRSTPSQGREGMPDVLERRLLRKRAGDSSARRRKNVGKGGRIEISGDGSMRDKNTNLGGRSSSLCLPLISTLTIFRGPSWRHARPWQSRTLLQRRYPFFLFSEEAKKERKDKLRETYLRFHPDKFESRLMKLVKTGEQEKQGDG
ncbi:uncharacterized protein EV420DRAFT_168198 [Desarmillaria tabescens]|uniref:Uncharacterized protein n=1 Tax=Armillaria tabescens TaxID=1929756 RepID=A0AA39N8H3_ARMTA|nr:uncharacterized protein EV420DRAFT_168198 [Desarmillaria tabescens]KAK0460953.1 hypothetical protein EV420DRAFT_168198 [Desarmillaria tabescens]